MRQFTKVGVAVAAAAGLMVGGASVGGALASGGGNLSPDTSGRDTLARATHAQRVFAAIHDDGTAGRTRGFKSSTRDSTGVYTVKFNRNIRHCLWQGTIGKGNFVGEADPGEIQITGRNGTKNGLYVTTFDSSGARADRPFLVLVVCS